jgi:hypothetical protein
MRSDKQHAVIELSCSRNRRFLLPSLTQEPASASGMWRISCRFQSVRLAVPSANRSSDCSSGWSQAVSSLWAGDFADDRVIIDPDGQATSVSSTAGALKHEGFYSVALVIGELSPGSGEPSPAGREASPVIEEPAPASRETSPGNGEASPIIEEHSPVSGETSQVVEEPSPGSEELSPANRETSPVIGELSPVVGELSPVSGEPSPVIGETPPVSEELSQNSGEPSRVVGELSQILRETSSATGEASPVRGESSPVPGETSPSTGTAARDRSSRATSILPGSSFMRISSLPGWRVTCCLPTTSVLWLEVRAVTTGPSSGNEVFAPGRQDEFYRTGILPAGAPTSLWHRSLFFSWG